MMKYSWKNKFFNLLSCIIFLILWQIIACIINNNIYLPKLNEIINSFFEILRNKNLGIIVLSTFLRTSVSYIAAVICAVIFGVLCITCPIFNYIVMPFNSFCKTIPTLVLIVLALIWFDKERAPFIVGFAIVFPLLYEGIKECFNEINNDILEMSRIYEISTLDKILKVYIPKIKFYLCGIFVSTFSLAFKVVIAGEVHGQPKFGIGSQIQIEKVNFNTCSIFAWIIIIVMISLVLDSVNFALKKRIYRWKYESNNK